MRVKLFRAGSASALIAALTVAAPAHAAYVDVSIFKNLAYTQTASGVSASPTSVFFDAAVTPLPSDLFSAVTVTYPAAGGSTQTRSVPQTDAHHYLYGPGFTNQAAMDAAFPKGAYTFNAYQGATGALTVTLDYTQDAYPQNVGALTAASYAALQGLRPTSGPLTVDFNLQTPSPLATTSFSSFFIYDAHGDQEPGSCVTPPSSTTSCTFDPSALAPDTAYRYSVDFSDRFAVTAEVDLGGVERSVLETVAFERRTIGTFTTGSAVPEPAVWALMVIGAAGVGVTLRRRKPKAALA